MIGFDELPSAMITRSTCIVSVLPVTTGARRREASGGPSSMTSRIVWQTEWDFSLTNSRGERSTFSSMPSSSAWCSSSTRAGISALVRR